MKTFETYCADNGVDPATLNDAYRKMITAAWKAECGEKPAPAGSGDKVIEAARRREEIDGEIGGMLATALEGRRINADTAERINLKAQAENWTKLQVENAILKAERPQVGAMLSRDTGRLDDEVIEAAVCISARLANPEKSFSPQVLEAASKNYRHGMGLEELILTYARRSGYTGLNLKTSTKAALQAAFAGDIRASGAWGPSTSGAGLSGLFSNVANKFLREGFMAVEDVWRNITAFGSANDFKQMTTYSLTGGLNFKRVPPGGEIKHGQISAESYTNQVDTRGVMLGLDRRDLVNDDLGALTSVGRRMGRGAALTLNIDFWTLYLNNSTFFTAGRGNVSTGAGSALSAAGLDAALQKFLNMTDPDGNPMGALPAILLVPPALWSTAAALMQSTGVNNGSTTSTPDANIWANRFRLYSSVYMQNTTLTGNSPAAWYLLAEPRDVPTVEVAFLNGNETPTVESADADFNQLGVSMRAFLDYGINFQEYRGGVRSAGS